MCVCECQCVDVFVVRSLDLLSNGKFGLSEISKLRLTLLAIQNEVVGIQFLAILNLELEIVN